MQRRTSWTGVPLAVALGIGVINMGVINVGTASAAPTPPAFMTSTVGNAITIAVVKDNPAGGRPNPICAPVVQEIRLDDQPGYRYSPPTSAEAIASGGIPALSAASTVVVPHDGIYAVGAVCRDPGGESSAPPLVVTIGGPPVSGPEVRAESWQKPVPVPGGPDKAVAVTVNAAGSPGPCGALVKQVSYVGKPFEFRSTAPVDFAPPGESRIVSALIPGPGTYLAVGTCPGYQTWPPVYVNVA